MRKICVIALAVMMGVATPLSLTESAYAANPPAYPGYHGNLEAFLAALIQYINELRHHQVSP